MKDGFKIADVDTHLMEPDYVFERYIDDRYKSAAPKMGIASESGRRTIMVEGESLTAEEGASTRSRRLSFLAAVRESDAAFRARRASLTSAPKRGLLRHG